MLSDEELAQYIEERNDWLLTWASITKDVLGEMADELLHRRGNQAILLMAMEELLYPNSDEKESIARDNARKVVTQIKKGDQR